MRFAWKVMEEVTDDVEVHYASLRWLARRWIASSAPDTLVSDVIVRLHDRAWLSVSRAQCRKAGSKLVVDGPWREINAEDLDGALRLMEAEDEIAASGTIVVMEATERGHRAWDKFHRCELRHLGLPYFG